MITTDQPTPAEARPEQKQAAWKKPSNEQRYYDALQRIARDYMTPKQIRRDAEKEKYGPDYEEYLEMSYENIQQEAARAIKGKRRPKQ